MTPLSRSITQSSSCARALFGAFIVVAELIAPKVEAMVPPSERAVLDAIWFGTGGQLPGGTSSTWVNRGGWGIPVFLGISECGSYGISCVVDQGQEHVSAISLDGNGLTGQLPASLSDLPYLSVFDVDNNDIGGSIPELSGLTRLVEFTAEKNQLTGAIPPLASLTSLEYFVVNDNKLSGSIPALAGVTNLQYFIVYDNELTGTIPSLGGLSSLGFFVASRNQLTGPVPAIAGMTTLQDFDVSSNRLTGTLPSLAGLSSLYWFRVSSNELSGAIPSLSDLVGSDLVFDVGGNRLTGLVPAAPPNLSQAWLCPNLFTLSNQPTIDPAWDAATGETPWWATPFTSNACDEVFYDGFEWSGPQ